MSALPAPSKAPRRCAGARSPAGGNAELGCGPEILVRERLGRNKRPEKFSLMPARLSSAAPNPRFASSQLTKNAAPHTMLPATGTQPNKAHASPQSWPGPRGRSSR